MTRVAIGLGSNLGDRLGHLQSGLRALSKAMAVEHCSSVWESDPMYYAPQPAFLNACCTGTTDLSPGDLLAELQEIEQAEGRRRRGPRFGPRELDLDLLLYGSLRIDDPQLRVPHPGLTERPFVLLPLAEVAGDWAVPGTGRIVSQLASGISRAGVGRHAAATRLMPTVVPGA